MSVTLPFMLDIKKIPSKKTLFKCSSYVKTGLDFLNLSHATAPFLYLSNPLKTCISDITRVTRNGDSCQNRGFDFLKTNKYLLIKNAQQIKIQFYLKYF